MTRDNQTALVQAYRAAIEAGQSEIAELLEKLILSEMRPNGPVMREATIDETTNPFGSVVYDKGVTLLGAKTVRTGIDSLSKEATV